ncbi:MAG: 4-hydroxythreonine-4-phosphate dehydrogenase PdxA [Deltaproteobacteria bacterium]|nr:4-hydroxythreonine-4-phosphate dehydrogenase PdxA [Deltaproteobacteria bacterium]
MPLSPNKSDRPLCIGITQGDPKGIGPEIVATAAVRFHADPTMRLTIYGDRERTGPDWHMPDATAGRISADAVNRAVDDLRHGRIDAVVTAPINKARWRAAGIPAAGHTEWLAALANPAQPPQTRMLFVAGRLRIALATAHIPLQDVPGHLTVERLRETVTITAAFLQQRLHIPRPRLACLGLNPHAGEGGLIGREEFSTIAPTVAALQAAGLDIAGPFPADGFFRHWHSGTPYDAVIALYHDQGLIPIKMLAPTEAVNVTMGLPFVRTSVGHGTAEDIAGTGRADPSNLCAAIRLAAQLARGRLT